MNAAAHPHVPYKGIITIAVMLASIMQVLDTTIANVALPHMQGSLLATQDQITWVLTSYIVASAIMTPPTGWLAGRFGRKAIFLAGIAGFTTTSVLCGIATSIEEMVFYRILQGVFGAALVPLAQATLLDINPKEKHGQAMALWGMGIMLGPILGPTLGGYLTEYYNWRWVFYINMPVGIASFVGVYMFLPETERHDRPFDFFGFIMLSLTIGGIQLLLDRGGHEDWFESQEIIVYALVTVGALWMYIWHSRFAQHPFLSVDMFLDRNFLTGLVFIFFVGLILLASAALMPLYMQNLMGYEVLDIGILMAPRGVGTMLAMMVVGKLTGRIDPRRMIATGLVLTAYSLWEMSGFTTFVPKHIMVENGIIQGMGLGLIFVPLNTIAFATLSVKYRTEGAGLFSLVRNLGSSIGVSVFITMFSHSVQMNHSYLAEHITPYRSGIASYQMPQLLPLPELKAALLMIDGEINRQAATIAYLNDFVLLMWIAVLSIAMVPLLSNPHHKPKAAMPPMMDE